MKIARILRKIPYIEKRIKILKPNVEDILLEFYDSDSKIIFLDIGANYGQTIDFINRLFHNAIIYSFEPTLTVFSDLKQKYLNLNNVHVYNIALADEDKQLDFYQSDYSPTNSCLEPNTLLYEEFSYNVADTLKKTRKLKVEGMKLDTWYNLNLTEDIIDIVKIDTQGFEYNVITGGLTTLKRKVKLLYFEIQYLDFYKSAIPFYKIFELLYNNGFCLYCHLSSSKRNKYQELESNVLFVNRNYIDLCGK
jgi:FkbM family methyltransferase